MVKNRLGNIVGLILVFFCIPFCLFGGWRDIRNGDFPTATIMSMSTSMYKGALYAAFCEDKPRRINVIKYDDKAGKWVNVIKEYMNGNGYVSINANENGVFLAYLAFGDAENNDKELIHYYKLDPGAAVMLEVAAPYEAGQSGEITLKFEGATPYILYNDMILYDDGKSMVKQQLICLDSKTAKWKPVGGKYIAQWDASNSFLWFEESVPYVGLVGLGGDGFS